jgi:microsomal dipeptidase-like Zn-dependent dipeptidase
MEVACLYGLLQSGNTICSLADLETLSAKEVRSVPLTYSRQDYIHLSLQMGTWKTDNHTWRLPASMGCYNLATPYVL